MCVGIFFSQVLRRFLELLDGLIRKVSQLLLERFALVRGCLPQIILYLFLLINKRVAGIEVRFKPLHFAFRFFRFFYLFLSCGSLLGDDVLEVKVDLRVFTAGYPAFDFVWRLLIIRRGEYDEYGVNARAHVRQAEFASAIRLALLLRALVAYRSNSDFGPGVPIHIHDCAADRSCLGRSTRCECACQCGNQDCGQHPRLMKTLHAPFSFFTGEPCSEYPGYVPPLSLSRVLIPSLPAAGSLSVRQKHFGGRGWDPSPRLPRRRATAARSCRIRRKPCLRSGNTTRLDAVARPVRCHAG